MNTIMTIRDKFGQTFRYAPDIQLDSIIGVNQWNYPIFERKIKPDKITVKKHPFCAKRYFEGQYEKKRLSPFFLSLLKHTALHDFLLHKMGLNYKEY
jgi:hypothetical protein